jgi:hypothetical protein
MFVMNNATLPLPQPGDWMTIGAAAHLMKVHARTIDRLIRKGALHSYSPWAAPTEKPPVMLWRDEVLQVHAARQKLAASGAGQ